MVATEKSAISLATTPLKIFCLWLFLRSSLCFWSSKLHCNLNMDFVVVVVAAVVVEPACDS